MRTTRGNDAGPGRRGDSSRVRRGGMFRRPVRTALMATAALAVPLTAVLAASAASPAQGSVALPSSVSAGLLSTVSNTVSSLSSELKNGVVLPSSTSNTAAAAAEANASNTAAAAAAANVVPVSNAPAGAVPLAPTSVKAAQASAAPDLAVSWSNATKGNATQEDLIQLWLVSVSPATLVTTLKCGGCTAVTFRELAAGDTYYATVIPVGANGSGASTSSKPVTMEVWCLVGACVSLDATTAIGPVDHAASGIQESLLPYDDDPADIKALDTTSYRGASFFNPDGSVNNTGFATATAEGAQNLIELDSLWKSFNGGTAPTPWSNWPAYSTFITNTVKQIESETTPVINYFEIFNEPGGNDGYYSTADYNSETPALLLQQFDVGYQAIMAADPKAQVVGPDLSAFEDYNGEYAPFEHAFDMVSFLNNAVANHIKLAAITWHEILDNYGLVARQNTLSPATMIDDVAEVRSLLAARPSLGNPKIIIDEYGIPEVQKIPGWDVEYLAAITNSHVYLADRSCWNQDCANPTLDGLLYNNGKSALPAYYDRLVYSAMSGNMISTGSSTDTVAVLGSYNSTTSTLTGLVGRGVGCSQNTTLCASTFADYTDAPPTSVLVTLNVPWSSGTAHVAMTNVPGGQPALPVGGDPQGLAALFPTLPASTPQAVTTDYPIVSSGKGRGTISILIPSFADGDAYGFSVTH